MGFLRRGPVLRVVIIIHYIMVEIGVSTYRIRADRRLPYQSIPMGRVGLLELGLAHHLTGLQFYKPLNGSSHGEKKQSCRTGSRPR